MTGEPNRYVGWSKPDPISHGDIVDLLYGLDCDDPNDPDTWKYRDRHLTGYEQVLVRGATPAQWDDAKALMALDDEDRRAHLDWLRFMLNALHPDEGDADG
jgi:hypothetical protein